MSAVIIDPIDKQVNPLKAEIQADKLGLGYDKLSYQAIADVMNTTVTSKISTIPHPNFRIWLSTSGLRATIQDIADTAGDSRRSAALYLLDTLQGGHGLDMSDADVVAMVDTLVTDEQKEQLVKLASVPSVLAYDVFGAAVSGKDILEAMK